MANKYKSWDKYMLSFTIPSTIKGKTIKKGRFTKLRILIDIRAYIAKLINNSDNVKYFMNIELGKAHSNPHIHIQLWVKKDNTSSTIIDLIKSKTIKKFNLISNRCFTTLPEHKKDVYHYVVKDYAKDLTDKQIWDLEVQKKRMRTQLGKKVRFYSKSTDMFSKKIYRIMYYTYGIVRDLANKYLISFLDKFFYFNKKNLPNIYSFCSCFSVLCYIEQEGNVLFISFILVLEVFSFAPGHDPPFIYHLPGIGKMVWLLQAKNLF